ncbi:hypothetical protein [Parabacteroides pacaensis]|nr:hypothetical protein [Parabacteroides pacaensis]
MLQNYVVFTDGYVDKLQIILPQLRMNVGMLFDAEPSMNQMRL